MKPAVVAVLVAALMLAAEVSATAQIWKGPTFREFSGANQGSPASVLTPYLGWDRPTLFFGSAETSRGKWDAKYMSDYKRHLRGCRQSGMSCLVILGYMASWAGPNPNGPPTNVSDWTDYVAHIVHSLHAAPYKEGYYQIWNEATPIGSGFYKGSFDDYMYKIHIPAAKVIHAAGCKVVWGGWPGGAVGPQDFINMMNKYSAWNTIDVVDLHYFNWNDLKLIHDYAVAHGHKNLGYWQSEIGFSTDPLTVPTKYISALDWALTSGVWTAKDRFKYFYFAEWAPDDPAGPAYHRCLMTGKSLNYHGKMLRTMANLLGGGVLSAMEGVAGTNLGNGSSVSAFHVGRAKDVIAVQLSAADYTASGRTILDLPLPRARILKAERVDLDGGNVVNITSSLVSHGTATNLDVSTLDAPGSDSAKWNATITADKPGWDYATFYVRLALKPSPNSHHAGPLRLH